MRAAGRLVFLSPPYSVGSAAGASDADSFCTASRPPSSASTFKALLATTTTSAAQRANLADGQVYVRPDGIAVGTGADIAAATPRSGIWEYADGSYPVSFIRVWSGASKPTSTAASDADTCGDWTRSVGTARSGVANSVDTFFTLQQFAAACTDTATSLYCVEQVL